MFYRGVQYPVCTVSKNQIDRAGYRLSHPLPSHDDDDMDNAIEVINNFRAGHNYPLLIFRLDLEDRARLIDVTSTVAQRLKRLPSIEAKLRRLSTRLTQMEDIGGCRAVVRTVGMVRRLANKYKRSKMRHKRLHVVDYIENPRETGYRGIHLIYSYQSKSKPQYNGLKIEIQLRSREQHAWATAVETVDAFTKKGLKDGVGIDVKWQRFFALMGTFIAAKERSRAVPNTPSETRELNDELRSLAKQLNVIQHLASYTATVNFDRIPDARFYLLELDASKGQTLLRGFKEDEFEKAEQLYLSREKELFGEFGKDVVLVSVGSLESLKRAYPNYFADSNVFIGIVSEAVVSGS